MGAESFKDKEKVLVSDRGEWFEAEFRVDKKVKTLLKVYMLEGIWKGGELLVHPGRVKKLGKKKKAK